MDLFEELDSLMVEYRFRPNKKKGQNFIINREMLDRLIKEASLSKDDTVLEIGAGTGFLTKELAKKCKVVAVEVDDTLFELLEKELGNNVKLVHGDFLDQKFENISKVVSLPPYTISSALMYQLFELKPKIAVLVLQYEFAKKLEAEAGFTEYTALSVMAQYYFDVKLVARVPSKSFFPRPNSESEIVKLSLSEKNGKAASEEGFKVFIKSIFRFKNKSLANAVKNALLFCEKYFPNERNALEAVLASKFASEKVYQLTCAELVEVFNQMYNAGKKN